MAVHVLVLAAPLKIKEENIRRHRAQQDSAHVLYRNPLVHRSFIHSEGKQFQGIKQIEVQAPTFGKVFSVVAIVSEELPLDVCDIKGAKCLKPRIDLAELFERGAASAVTLRRPDGRNSRNCCSEGAYCGPDFPNAWRLSEHATARLWGKTNLWKESDDAACGLSRRDESRVQPCVLEKLRAPAPFGSIGQILGKANAL